MKPVIVNGKYEIIKKIGCGSFGDVYLARHVINGEVTNKLC